MPLGEAVLRVRRLVQRRYGKQVVVRFIDVEKAEAKKYPKVMSLILQNSQTLPVVSFNDETLFVGELPRRELQKILDDKIGRRQR